MNVNISNWVYVVFSAIILTLTGAAEYIHLAPAGSFYTILLLVIGLGAPSPIAAPHNPVMVAALDRNTKATQENTQVATAPVNDTNQG